MSRSIPTRYLSRILSPSPFAPSPSSHSPFFYNKTAFPLLFAGLHIRNVCIGVCRCFESSIHFSLGSRFVDSK